ncbi:MULTISPECIES: lytic transglycosylase domain-containing protein [unclassified Shewanella]|jgi:membrane-bound lytic murein transglycosylase B|uniref:lytic murein transglycosylase n=1 Tax=unclassified Shewanella TaxID=196818 RepID=UPI00137C18D5|nr:MULTISPECIES: lytic murein transglycosylase [unclassified Shewanella]MBO1898274.1 lytic murein transglycosylase [Shewanella sp. BF02_Schw]QHS13255.1 lytic murein transglycosylase [Shewanella sp. Arc9-LZ]
MIQKIILCAFCYFICSNIAMAEDSRGEFSDYLLELQQRAIATGVNQLTAERYIANIKIFKKASLNTHSDESQTLEHFIPQAVPEITVSTARAMFQQHESQIENISRTYQVQSRFLMALWGMNSRFGERTGRFSGLSVLASLAYKGDKEAFYINEFIAALKLIEQKNITEDLLQSSSSGAMGQMQMMPSQILQYGIDADKDGIIDVWSSMDDAFASTANMLHQQDWQYDSTWGRQVKTTMMLDPNLLGLQSHHTFPDWQAYGVRRFDGADLPQRNDMEVSLIAPDGPKGRFYLTYNNFRLLHQFNNSLYDTLAITYLSEKIKQ